MARLNSSDFYQVPDLRFDISKLRSALKKVLSRKSYDDAAGTKYISGICLNQIPGKPESITGENVKGIYRIYIGYCTKCGQYQLNLLQ